MIAAVLLLTIFVAFLLFYFHRIWHFSLIPRYSDKFSLEFFEDKHGLVNPLYYWNYIAKGIFRPGLYKFDKEGVFVFYTNNNAYYHPAAIPQVFLSFLFEQTADPSKDKRKEMDAQLKWIVANAKEVGDDQLAWYYLFDYHGAKAPWTSGISQGFMISVLTRASLLYQDIKYLEMARKAFNFMDKSIEEGGHRFSDDQYPLFYEEGHNHNHILNGHIFSLFGVYDLYMVTKEEKYKSIFDRGLVSIKKNIKDFTLGFFSKYAGKTKETSNNSYHHLHINLMKAIYIITGDTFFKDQAADMEHQNHSLFCKIRHLFYLIKLNVQMKISKDSE